MCVCVCYIFFKWGVGGGVILIKKNRHNKLPLDYG